MEIVKFLGEGSYGHVDLIIFTNPDGSNPDYEAVKTSYGQSFKYLVKEFKILSKLRDCPRIVRGINLWRGVNGNGVEVCRMSMEYAAGGNLKSLMETKMLTDSMIRDFTFMILQGLVSIHSHGYVHCDLKPDNILVFPRTCGSNVSSYELKISDFGMSTKDGKESKFWEFESPFLGTPFYMSPESVHNGVAEKALDLWSLGCIVLQMYTRKSPWPLVNDFEELLHLLLDVKTPKIPESLPSDAREFLQTCFASNPVERGTATELLKHKFLQSVFSEKFTYGIDKRKLVILCKSKHSRKKTLKVKTKPPKPPRPLKLRFKIIKPPNPPESNLVPVQL